MLLEESGIQEGKSSLISVVVSEGFWGQPVVISLWGELYVDDGAGAPLEWWEWCCESHQHHWTTAITNDHYHSNPDDKVIIKCSWTHSETVHLLLVLKVTAEATILFCLCICCVFCLFFYFLMIEWGHPAQSLNTSTSSVGINKVHNWHVKNVNFSECK